ncbi:uncharacterized protein LAESUDRAFT_118774 [Laetiporus sulphureus 93-53]|uniref:Uncharacterized protein n=1 Tax=Laetiporus sulphureus 93-53 TaxID=1314785 RepID=A0A165EJM9_9APHY|nr:uncharacterized protein LAESUDRAFT_118774 [Laetiporus sulphureus 93-53]KZT07189.1 hypothetical protein LAESUDRAFT_118774 [Laetiporus sulphureus 93-53]
MLGASEANHRGIASFGDQTASSDHAVARHSCALSMPSKGKNVSRCMCSSLRLADCGVDRDLTQQRGSPGKHSQRRTIHYPVHLLLSPSRVPVESDRLFTRSPSHRAFCRPREMLSRDARRPVTAIVHAYLHGARAGHVLVHSPPSCCPWPWPAEQGIASDQDRRVHDPTKSMID